MTTVLAVKKGDDTKTNNETNKKTKTKNRKPLAKVQISTEKVMVGNTVGLVENRYGLVRFKGHTKFGKGIWYGIEIYHLILKTRHNGTICRKRYFNCPRNKGLFVRRGQISSIIKFKDVKKILKKLEKEQMAILKALKFPSKANIPTKSKKKKKRTNSESTVKPLKSTSKVKSYSVGLKLKNAKNIKSTKNDAQNVSKAKKTKESKIKVKNKGKGKLAEAERTDSKNKSKNKNTKNQSSYISASVFTDSVSNKVEILAVNEVIPLANAIEIPVVIKGKFAVGKLKNIPEVNELENTPKPYSPILKISPPAKNTSSLHIGSKSTGFGMHDNKSLKLEQMKELLGIKESVTDILTEEEENELLEKQMKATFARYSRLSMMTESLPDAVFQDIQHEDSDYDSSDENIVESEDEDVKNNRFHTNKNSTNSGKRKILTNALGIRTGRSQSLMDKLLEDEVVDGFNIDGSDRVLSIIDMEKHSDIERVERKENKDSVDDDLFGDSKEKPFYTTLNVDELSNNQEYLVRLYYPFKDYISQWDGRKSKRRGSGGLDAMTIGKKNIHALKKGLYVKIVNTQNKCGRELLMEFGIQSNQGWCIIEIQGENIAKKSKKKIQKILNDLDYEQGYDVLFKHIL